MKPWEDPETLQRCHEDLSGLDSKGGTQELGFHDIVAESQDLHGTLGVISGVVLSKAINIALTR